MDLLTLILIGVGLAMDCFAVSTAQGLGTGRWHPRCVGMALLFGAFQGGMPLIGYYAGTLFSEFFSRFAPWIALGLLAFIGGKMVWESVGRQNSCLKDAAEPLKDASLKEGVDWRLRTLIVLAIATSIDALATGVIFIPVPEVLWLGVGVIALTSLLFSLAGYLIGVYVGKKFRLNVELIGGIILIGIGIKIFVEGVCF